MKLAVVPRTRAWTGRVGQEGGLQFQPGEEADPRSCQARAGALAAFFSGYLFDTEVLQKELDTAGNAGPVSPAAIVLEGYRRWGEGVLDRLQGVFALAIWDQREEILLCARDAIGLHPLFYSQPGRHFLFSWDAETLRRQPEVSSDLDAVVVAEDLIHRFSNVHETHYRGVRRLPSGHALRFRQGRVEVFPYWNPAPPGRPIRWVTREEVTEFPNLLARAIERAVRIGPAGILLSGGLDSISVAIPAAEITARLGWPAFRAYCMEFPGQYNEASIQRGVAEALGMSCTFRSMRDYFEGRGLLRRVLEQSQLYPWPAINIYAPGYTDLLWTARSDGCKVVLTGEGGDEWLCVTPIYAADLIRAGQFGELFRLVRTTMGYWKLGLVPGLRNALWTCGARAVARDWMWRRFPQIAMRRRRQLLPQALPDWLAPDPGLHRELEERFLRWNRDPCHGSFYLDAIRETTVHPLVSMACEESFYRDLHTGVPCMHPYQDRQLVEFLLRTPPDLLNDGGQSKALVRGPVARRFPELGLLHQKKMTSSRFNQDLYRRECPPLWRELGGAQFLAQMGVVQLDTFHGMLDRSLASKTLSVTHRVWHGANVEAWVRSHV
jgi:asparagine synthase (glutamine-hydrolysing)